MQPEIHLSAGFFHTGLVVTDLDAAMAELSAATGVSWRQVVDRTASMWSNSGVREVAYRRVFSVEGPPYLELMETSAGYIWETSGRGQTHHLGYWSEDVREDARRFDAQGMERVLADVDGSLFTVHRAKAGFFVELVSSSMREALVG